jgi:cyclopropane-fatty-acyl-phospholipid synthase
LNFFNRRGLRRLLWAPNELGFARAYVSGDIDIEGDLLAGLDVLEQMSDPSRGPGVRIDAETKKALAKAALRLGIIGLPPKPPTEEAKLARGHRHEKRRDATAISHHYDVGNDFYRLVLGESMTYSCGYWAQPSDDLAAAQYAKCDLVARKLGLTAGMRVLDVGCGWGTFALHAARHYGTHVVGVTLSHEQAEFASKRMVAEGLSDLVEIRVQDYRDVADGRSTRSRASAWPSTSASRCCRRMPRNSARCCVRRDGCSTMRSRGDRATVRDSPRPRSSIAMFSPTEKLNRWRRW